MSHTVIQKSTTKIDENNTTLSNKHCYSCGKTFRTPANLLAHKNRKTPCVIQDVPNGDEGNPLRCMYCNKVFAQVCTVTRHYKTCKIRNGGMQILVDKTKHEQEIYELRIQVEALKTTVQKTLVENAHMAEELKILKCKPNVVNNTQINNTQLVFNSWHAPDFRSLIEKNDQGVIRFIDMINQHGVQTPLQLIDTIWYNPALPANLSIYLVNKQTEETLCWDGTRWCITDSTTIGNALRERCYHVTDKLGTKLQKLLSANQQQLVAQCAVNRPDPELTKFEIDEIKRAVYAGRTLTRQHRGRITAG